MEIPQGTGSEFCWDDDGHIVTNYHVIQNARRLKVTLDGAYAGVGFSIPVELIEWVVPDLIQYEKLN